MKSANHRSVQSRSAWLLPNKADLECLGLTKRGAGDRRELGPLGENMATKITIILPTSKQLISCYLVTNRRGRRPAKDSGSPVIDR
jgi:hypothetical protein